ncbi:MAG: uroporphyrinogen decarboxylase family protein [Spirochaetota bacterium]
MKKRDIMFSIIRDKKAPERMGVYEHFWPFLLQDHWQKQGLPEGTDTVAHFDYDLRNIGGWFNTQGKVMADEIIHEDDETKVVRNGWGAELRYWKKKSGTPEHIGFSLSTSALWKEKYRDNFSAIDTRRFGDLAAMKANYAKHRNDDVFTVFSNLFIFEMMRASMGDVVMSESAALEPAWIHDYCSVMTDFMIEHYDYLFREVGKPDGMFIYEDLGYTKDAFFSPAMHRELILPYHKKFFGFLKDHKLPVIMHTCGNIVKHIPAIIESGVDCLQPMEAKTGMNVVELGQTYAGKLSFMGNINIMALETNDRAAIDAEILPKLAGVRKLRIPYVFHSDHSISYDVKLSTYEYALDLFRKNCTY